MFRNFLPTLRKRSKETQAPTSIADLMEAFWRDPFGALAGRGEAAGLFPFGREGAYPSLDVSESDKEVVVKAELPGLDPKDVDISISGDVLLIKGEKKFEEEEKKDNYHRIERSYGSFARGVPLPAPVKESEVKAKFDKGVLTIVLPKDEAAKPKRITIES